MNLTVQSVIRIIVWIFFFITPFFKKESVDIPSENVFILSILFIFSLTWPLALCCVRAFFYREKRKWKRPSLNAPIVKGIKPLQFWWFFYIGFTLMAVGYLCVAIVKDISFRKDFLLYSIVGIGGLIGVKLSELLFKDRFEDK